MIENPEPLLRRYIEHRQVRERQIVEVMREGASTADYNDGKAAIGTGPYRFVEFVPGDRIVLARNDAYWGPKPAWQRATLKIITNNAA